MVCRECIYYVNLRQAYLLSPNYAKRLSSRTVLFTCIPKPYLEEAKLRKLFGDSAKNIWIPRNTRYLRGLVDDREKTAERLEKAEIRLIRLANRIRNRHLKKFPASTVPKPSTPVSPTPSQRDASHDDAEKGKVESAMRFAERQVSVLDTAATPELEQASERAEDPEYTHPYGLDPSLADVRGSVAAMWIPAEKRPHHRPLKNFGRRVDTIRWCRARLKSLNRDIWKLRRKHRGGDGSPLSAAFIEFDTQANAQAAFQILTHHQPLHMSPRFIGIRPEEINWGALRIKWWEHIMRRFLMMAVITLAIVFWSFPSAFVGLISNLDELAGLAPFLSWILLIPKPILDVIKGLLPALALSLLMAAVPMMLRGKWLVRSIFYIHTHTHSSLWESCRYPIPRFDRIIRTEWILCLPDRPGFPRHYAHLSRIGRIHRDSPRPSLCQRFALKELAQGIQLLLVLHPRPVFGCGGSQPRQLFRPLPTPDLGERHD